MSWWLFDAFFWLVLPIAAFEGLRIGLLQRSRAQRSLPVAVGYGGLELISVTVLAATNSLFVFMLAALLRIAFVYAREREWWVRGGPKTALIVVAAALLMGLGGIDTLAEIGQAKLDPSWRIAILSLVSAACAVAIVPVRVSEEPKETLAAPLAFIGFARLALPLAPAEPRFATVVPIVAAVIALVCALWLLSAGRRANHFEPATLVSELLVCERGVLLAFVWLGLASGDHLAGVGALIQWWSGALALLALEAALRRRPLAKPMAFFALGMAVCLPGTLGFVAEDLLAHGLLELRPLLAAAFVGVAALNAAALYLAIVNIIVDVRGQHPLAPTQPEARPSFMMLGTAGLSLLMGVLPRPFVAEAARAHDAIAHQGDPVHVEP